MREYGPCLKLIRGKKFFAFNQKGWETFREEIPAMTQVGNVVMLSYFKRVSSTMYNDELYISFEQDWTNSEGKRVKSFMNLDARGWRNFIKILWQVDEIMGVGYTQECTVCLDNRIPKKMVDKRIQKTKLTVEAFNTVHMSNAIGEELDRCDYCGRVSVFNGCHCHKYDCHECCSDNFCTGCGSNKYVEY